MIDRGMFYDRVLPIFGKQLTAEQVEGCEASLKEYEREPLFNLDGLAYELGTEKWETCHTMQPVRETLAKTDAAVRRILAGVWYAVPDPVTGMCYYGRGKCQLTHKYNYFMVTSKLGDRFKIDFVKDPDAALRMDAATVIIMRGMNEGWFAGNGKRMADFFVDGKAPGYVAARSLINGTARAADIAQIALQFRYALGGSKAARILHLGMMNDPDVARVQKALMTLGYDLGDGKDDGDFGPTTKRAVQAFQKRFGLDPDGVAGPQTQTALKL